MKVCFRIASCVSILSFLGCAGGETDAPTLHPVKGKVTKGGQGLANVQVTFAPAGGGGRGATGNTSEDGSYSLISPNAGPGVPAGQYKVLLTASSDDAAAMSEAYTGGGDPGDAAGTENEIPTEYSSAETTPKTVEVKEGENVIDIEL